MNSFFLTCLPISLAPIMTSFAKATKKVSTRKILAQKTRISLIRAYALSGTLPGK
jgi:hypothetical protein